MLPADPFSSTYLTARQRFRDAAAALGARLACFDLDTSSPRAEDLSIDVAFVGVPDGAAAVVVSSGLHGVEGFLGSAIQLAWMSSQKARLIPAPGCSLVLVHAINPFGFASLRRTDEHNIDLNRNFLATDEPYEGVPPGYADLDPLLNPASPPAALEPFRLRALWRVWRHGVEALKRSVAVGQYEHAAGLFFGGRRPAPAARIVQENFRTWIGAARDVVHVDIHSGLGSFGSLKLLLAEPPAAPEVAWYRERFGGDRVEGLADGLAYPARGTMGSWLRRNLSDLNYRFLGAEFGTHSILRVLAALRAENRAHFYSQPTDSAYARAKKELLECFCPASRRWRRTAIARGLETLRAATAAAMSMSA